MTKKRHDDSYLTDFCKTIRDMPENVGRPSCRVFTTTRGKKFVQHRSVLVFMDDKFIEYRCVHCLEYQTYRHPKTEQFALF